MNAVIQFPDTVQRIIIPLDFHDPDSGSVERVVSAAGGRVEVNAPGPLTPEQALVLACCLKEAAECPAT